MNPPRIFLNAAQAFEMVHAMADILRRSRTSSWPWCACRARAPRDAFFPFGRRAFQPRDARANLVVQNFRAAAGNRIEPRIAQPHNRVAQRKPRNFRDAGDFRRGKAVQVNLRKSLLDRAAACFRRTRSANPDAGRPASARPCRPARSSPGFFRRSFRAAGCSRPSRPAGGKTRRTSNIRCRNSCN